MSLKNVVIGLIVMLFLQHPTTSQAALPGDLNGDGVVSIAEVQTVINAFLGITSNTPPTASAGTAQSVVVGAVVALDGSASSDANGDPLTYSWAFSSKPVGSSALLSSATVAKPVFTPDVAGAYVLSLVVNDGKVNSVTATITVAATSSVSGKVADGYLVSATIFMDKNGNYQLDPGEPYSTTDANGTYTLNVDPSDVGKYPIVANATMGVTFDRDNNVPVTNSYVLSMPAIAISGTVNSNFISPMSSLLREMMETGIYATKQQALNALVTNMGLPAGTDIMADYIAANNTTIHKAAQIIVTLMGNQMVQLLGTYGSTLTVDVNRYRSMMGTIFSNMSTIVGTNVQTGTPNSIDNMSSLNNTITTVVSNTPRTSVGQP